MLSANFLNKGGVIVVACAVCISGYAVSLQPAYAGEAVRKAHARVTLSNLAQTYNGAPKRVKVATTPKGLAVSIAYDGNAAAPVNAGQYTVIATVQDAHYEGSATGRMAIAKASQKIMFNSLDMRVYGDGPFDLSSTVSSGLTTIYESSNPAVAVISGNTVMITGAGSTRITASQAGDQNHRPAKPVKRVLTVKKAPQTITFAALEARPYSNVPFFLKATGSSGLAVTFASSNPAVATVRGSKVRITGAGTTEITAYQAGGKNYRAAEPIKQVLTVNKAKAKVTLSTLAHTYDGAPKRVKAATRPKGLAVSITYGGNPAAPVNAGQYAVIAEVQDANYEGGATGSMTIAKAPQRIVFNAPAAWTYGDVPFDVSAMVSSGLTTTFESSNPAVAVINGNTVTITGAGSTEITAYQGGNGDYLPANPVRHVLTVEKAGQKITFHALAAVTYGAADFPSEATANSGLPVLYTSSNPSVAAFVESRVHIVGAGSSTIMATQSGDNNYRAADPVEQALTVNKANAKVILTDLDQTYDGTIKQAVAMTEPERLQATLTYDNNAAAPTNAGAYAVVGTVKDVNYEGSAAGSLTIAKAGQKIAFHALAAVTYGDADFSPGAAVSSGLPVLYASSNPSVATFVGGQVHIIGAGVSTITASHPGDNNYLAAEPVTQVLTVKKTAQTITFSALEARPYSKVLFFLEATASSGLTLAYESSNTAVASVSGNQVTIRALGTTTITASQPGDDNHLAAAPVKQVLTVRKATANVTLGALKQAYDGEPKPATIKTRPAGLSVSITYDGSDKAPVNAGSYTVTASVHDATYEGSATETITISKAVQRIRFDALAVMTYGDRPFDLSSEVSSGLIAAYESSDPAVAMVTGSRVTIVGAGTAVITASQAGDSKYLGAEPVSQTLIVKKAPPRVTLGNLEQTYDGKPKPATSITSPPGLAVRITYDGNAAAPVHAGHYEVIAEVQDANYAGRASGTMTIAKAPQKIKFPVLAVKTVGYEPFELTATASSGLTPVYESPDTTVVTIIGGKVRPVGAGAAMITAYQAGDGNYEPADPVKQLLTVRSQKPRIVVLPVDNLSGKPAPLKEIRQALIQGVVNQGAAVPDDGDLERFMARHRVRYTGGIDTFTSQALKEEMGIEAVLITSLEQYVDTPRIALTARLVSTGDVPHILWMESIGLAGDDSFGVCGLGLIGDLPRLQKKALEQTIASLARFFSSKPLVEHDRWGGLYQPKIAYKSRFIVPGGRYTVAIFPFFNRSNSRRADEIIALHLISQLTKSNAFDVVEPGVVRQKLLNFRMILQEGLSLSEADLLFNSLETDFLFTGKIGEYFDEGNPKIDLEVLVYERTGRKVIWSSLSYNQGNDGVFFFDWRQVNNAGVLASKMARTVVRSMITQ